MYVYINIPLKLLADFLCLKFFVHIHQKEKQKQKIELINGQMYTKYTLQEKESKVSNEEW